MKGLILKPRFDLEERTLINIKLVVTEEYYIKNAPSDFREDFKNSGLEIDEFIEVGLIFMVYSLENDNSILKVVPLEASHTILYIPVEMFSAKMLEMRIYSLGEVCS